MSPINFGVKSLKVKVTSHKNITSIGLCSLVSAGFFYVLFNLHNSKEP